MELPQWIRDQLFNEIIAIRAEESIQAALAAGVGFGGNEKIMEDWFRQARYPVPEEKPKAEQQTKSHREHIEELQALGIPVIKE